MSQKNKITNKQMSAEGLKRIDNGTNIHEEERKNRQKKCDNVKPR